MKLSDKARHYIIIMLIGVVLNVGLYYVAHFLRLPMWIDSIGTAYVAVALEPAAGLLVAFATNFYQAAIIYDSSSLIYYIVSAIAALTFGIILRKEGKICWKRLPFAILSYFLIATTLASLITIWRTASIPDSGWERLFYQQAIDSGMNRYIACFYGTAVLKIIDTFIIAIVLPILYSLTPKSMKNKVIKDPVSLKNPFWSHKLKSKV